MSIANEKFKDGLYDVYDVFEKQIIKNRSGFRNPFDNTFDTTGTFGALNDDNYVFENFRTQYAYWKLSPSSDGTTSSPTITLNHTFNGTCFFVDISSNAVVVKLPPVGELPIGYKVHFILSEASEGEATKNFGIITADTDTDINGYIGGGGAIQVTANTSSVYWDTSDGASSGGDWGELITDGAGWYIKGHASLANAVDIADGHDVTT